MVFSKSLKTATKDQRLIAKDQINSQMINLLQN